MVDVDKYSLDYGLAVCTFSQVSAGCGHTGFVTEKGHAFTFGDNRYGQLGMCVCTL